MKKTINISERQFRQMIREELLNRGAVDEVAPPGDEHVVKALKKDEDVDNPWALAWWLHNQNKKKASSKTNESASRDCNCGCNDCNKPKKYEVKRPFIEKRISENVIMRTFDHTLSADEYVWHRDRNDRVVTVLEGRDWYLQHDNQLPQKLEEGRAYRIPRGTWHRIIKGSTHLNVMITEAKAKHR